MAKIKKSDVFTSKDAPNQSQSVNYAMTSPDEFGRIEADRLGRMAKAGLSLATEVDRLKNEDSKLEVLDAINKQKIGLSQKIAEIYAQADPKDIPRLVEQETIKAFQPLKKNGDRYFMYNLGEAVKNERTKNVDKAVLFAQTKLYEKHKQVIADDEDNRSTEYARMVTDGLYSTREQQGDPDLGETRISISSLQHSLIRDYVKTYGKQPTDEQIKDMMDETLNKAFTILQESYTHANLPMLKNINKYLKNSKALTVEAQAKNDKYIETQSYNLATDNYVSSFINKHGNDFRLDTAKYLKDVPAEYRQSVYKKLENIHAENKKAKVERQAKNYDILYGLIKEGIVDKDGKRIMPTLSEIEQTPQFHSLTEQQQEKIRQLYRDDEKIGNPILYKQIWRQIMIDGKPLADTEWDSGELSPAQINSLITADKNRLSKIHRTEIIDVKNELMQEYNINSPEWENGLFDYALKWIKSNPNYRIDDLKKIMEQFTLKKQKEYLLNNGGYAVKPKTYTTTQTVNQINQFYKTDIDRNKTMMDNITYNPNDYTRFIFNENLASAILQNGKIQEAFESIIGEYKDGWGFIVRDTISNDKLFEVNYAKTYSRMIADINNSNKITNQDKDFYINQITPFMIIDEMLKGKTDEQALEIGIRL